MHRTIATWACAALLATGCNSEPTPEPTPIGQAVPEPPEAARKRVCIETSLLDADPRYHTLIRSLCAEWIERDIPGLALAIAEPGSPPFELVLGTACNGEPASVEPNTPFRYGSISKTFTASLAMALISDAKLGLDTHASAWVPELHADVPDPTLAALLQHRSGLAEIVPAELLASDGAWLPALARSGAAGPVGGYHYSNVGYAVIGAVLSAAAGHDYAQLLTTRISTPLRLRTITAVPSEAKQPACGHLDIDPARQAIRVTEDLAFMPGDPRWMNPAGGVLGSAGDLARFALAIGTDALPGTAAMLEPGEPLPADAARPTRKDERYGYGLRSWALDEHTRAYGHSGNNRAFAAELLFVPGRRAIVILANCGVGLPASLAAAERTLD